MAHAPHSVRVSAFAGDVSSYCVATVPQRIISRAMHDGRKYGAPPGQRQQEQDVPVKRRPGPVADHAQKHVIKDVPDPERNQRVREPLPPRPRREHADGEEHQEGRPLAHQLDVSQECCERQRRVLIRNDAIGHQAKVVDTSQPRPRPSRRQTPPR